MATKAEHGEEQFAVKRYKIHYPISAYTLPAWQESQTAWLMLVPWKSAADQHPTRSPSQLAEVYTRIFMLAPRANRNRIEQTRTNSSDGAFGGV
jgi:hypothetical protein